MVTAPGWEVHWRGESHLTLPDGRSLSFVPSLGAGLRADGLAARRVVVAQRRGGERLCVARGRPTRTLKNLFQEFDVPPSERLRLPLVFVDGRLVFVPGVGVDPDFAAGEGEPGILPQVERVAGRLRSPARTQSD